MTICDTVSCFVDKGKKKALNIIQNDQNTRDAVQALGSFFSLSQNNLNRLEEMVRKTCGDSQCKSADYLRHNSFCMGKNVQPHQLPPAKAALKHHLKRANYQAYIWKHALES